MYNLKAEISALVRFRILTALASCGGNKSAAAELLGLGSYQTLKNWMTKHNVENISPERLKNNRVECFEAAMADENQVMADENQVMAEYGFGESGASLGDILEAAMKAKNV